MLRQPPNELLNSAERRLFMEQFEKDLEFFQLFFLLINQSCPIKKIDLVWAHDGPAGRVGLRQLMGTVDALKSPCSRLLRASDKSPDPTFCNIVNDYGRHEAESCGISDKAAERDARKTGKSLVYRCHAGLVDIAVPVVCEGQYIATLLTGQVSKEPPSEDGLVQIQNDVARLKYIDQKELAKAYWQVPVVSDEDIRNTVRILEVFAEYLATSWGRLAQLVKEQRRKYRESQLYRKELAHILLEGDFVERSELRELSGRVGLARCPSRVLLVKLETEEEYSTPKFSFDLALTSASQAIEELGERFENFFCTYIPKRGLCIFVADPDACNASSSGIRARALARQILNAIAGRTGMRARVGIGSRKNDCRTLVDSYHEAYAALASTKEEIATFNKQPVSMEKLSAFPEDICRLLREKKLSEARVVLFSLPSLLSRNFGDGDDQIPRLREFLSCFLDSLCFTLHKLGVDTSTVDLLHRAGNEAMGRAPSAFELHETFLQSAEEIVNECRWLYTGKRKKLIERARRMLDRAIEQELGEDSCSLPGVASCLGVSAGHLSRTFRKAVGQTFEHYIMVKRVEIAKRLLLDPVNNISAVSDKCGFSDPGYFARVFRKIAGCSPSQYANDPLRLSLPTDGYREAPESSTLSSMGRAGPRAKYAT